MLGGPVTINKYQQKVHEKCRIEVWDGSKKNNSLPQQMRSTPWIASHLWDKTEAWSGILYWHSSKNPAHNTNLSELLKPETRIRDRIMHSIQNVNSERIDQLIETMNHIKFKYVLNKVFNLQYHRSSHIQKNAAVSSANTNQQWRRGGTYKKIIVPFLVSVINPSKWDKYHIEHAVQIPNILWPWSKQTTMLPELIKKILICTEQFEVATMP